MLPSDEKPTPENTENYYELLAAGKARLAEQIHGLNRRTTEILEKTYEQASRSVGHSELEYSPQDLLLSYLDYIVKSIQWMYRSSPQAYDRCEVVVHVIQAWILQTVDKNKPWEEFTRDMLSGLEKAKTSQIRNMHAPAIEFRIVATELRRRAMEGLN